MMSPTPYVKKIQLNNYTEALHNGYSAVAWTIRYSYGAV